MKSEIEKPVLIQSLWMAGSQDARTYKGSWATAADHWYAVTLSACRLRRLYPKRPIVFVGDDASAAAATDLKLPYSEITNALQGFQATRISPNAGRLAAQLTVKQPYYHVDTDVLLFKPIPTWLDSHRVVAWSIDPRPGLNYNFKKLVEPAAMAMANALDYVPESWDQFLEEGGAYSCQIIGGRDIDFLHDYSETVLKVLAGSQNQEIWPKIETADERLASIAGGVVERLTLYTHARMRHVPVVTVFSESESEVKNYEQRAAELGLLHYGMHKKHQLAHHWRSRTRLLLKDEFPEAYRRVKEWLGDKRTDLRIINTTSNPACIFWHSGLCGLGEFNGTPSYHDCRNRCQKRSDASDKRNVNRSPAIEKYPVPGAWMGDTDTVRVSLTVLKARQQICDACSYGKEKDRDGHATRCEFCGCPLVNKQQLVNQSCPLISEEYPKGKWAGRVK